MVFAAVIQPHTKQAICHLLSAIFYHLSFTFSHLFISIFNLSSLIFFNLSFQHYFPHDIAGVGIGDVFH